MTSGVIEVFRRLEARPDLTAEQCRQLAKLSARCVALMDQQVALLRDLNAFIEALPDDPKS